MGPEVAGDVVQLTISREPKHISYEAFLPRARLPLRHTHYLDVVTPLTGRLGWRCLMKGPGHQHWVFYLHICYPEACLAFPIVHQFQVGRLYKWPTAQYDKQPKATAIYQSLEIIFHQKIYVWITPTVWASNQEILLQLTKKYWSQPVTWNLFLNKNIYRIYILYIYVLYPYIISIDCNYWMYKPPYHNSELFCCLRPLGTELNPPSESTAVALHQFLVM